MYGSMVATTNSQGRVGTMDTTLLGSIIQAAATVLTGVVAVLIAVKHLRLSQEQIIHSAD